jgi:ubiquinone biosynthesis monooxygenase Coq6
VPIRNFSLPPDKFSNRCSSLTPSSVRFLDKIGAWKHIDGTRVASYEEIQVWDGITGTRIEFGWPAKKGRTLAYMNENLNLTSALLRRVEELGAVEVLDGELVQDIMLGEETEEIDLRSWPVVSLSGGRKLAARLLVGADGANSPVRTFSGIGSRGWDYDRMGVVATLKMDGEGRHLNKNIAYQRFLPTGPVALLPLPGRYATLVWSTTPALAAHLKSLSSENFMTMVNAAFRLSPTDLAYMHDQADGQSEELFWRSQHTQIDPQRIPHMVVGVQEGSIASFPLKLRHADTYIGERVALVGDAAHTTHPLAGQGLNQGQGDVESLVKTIEYAVAHGQDIGVPLSLEAYNAERYAANNLLLGVVDKLHKLYSIESGPMVPFRSLGLKAVNALTPLKQFFMEQASGIGIKML